MKILFICTHNACRSIIGEAVSTKIASPRIEARSAGSNPRGVVHPFTLKHLKRHGYDITDLKSESWDGFSGWHPDVVITLCDQAAGETCPVYFGASLKVHWGLPDPSKDADNQNDNFDKVINTLETRIKKLLTEKFEDMDQTKLKLLFNKVI